MLPAWLALAAFAALIALFFAVAAYGDRSVGHSASPVRRRAVYALAICSSCIGWTFLMPIGVASRRGSDFLPLYLGPVLLFALFYPLVIRIIRLSKEQNIASIADFVAVRYGKQTSVSVTIALIASIGCVPFIAQQIGTIAQSLSIFLSGSLPPDGVGASMSTATGIAIALGGLTMAIGTRRLAATDNQRGLILAVATDAVIKFVAFVGVGAFVCWGMFHGLGDLTQRVTADAAINSIIDARPTPSRWLSMILVSFTGALVLPRAFYVTVVENRHEADVQTAAWLVPIYVLAICLLIMPVAAAGLSTFPNAAFDRDFTIFALPIRANVRTATLVALIGALSAAITTILLSATAMAVMVANDLVMPLYLRVQRGRRTPEAPQGVPPILLIRRLAVAAILASAWVCAICLPAKALSSLAVTCLVCAIQIAPAAIGGLVWDRGTARGAVGGCAAGVLAWGYTLFLPSITAKTSPLLTDGPLGFDALRPTNLFDLDLTPMAQGVFWSLSLNTLVYVGLSLSRLANANERRQASLYVRRKPMALAPSVRLRPLGVATGDLLATAALYVGDAAADAAFREFHATRDLEFDAAQDADTQLLKHTENLIASAIGAASSRTVISHLLERHETSDRAAMRIVDDVALEVQSSADVLQHAIDIARDGMAVFDRDLRLVAWNRAYRDMFRLPPELMRVGVPLDVLVRSNAERNLYGRGDIDDLVASRLETLTRPTEGSRLHSAFGRVLEMHSVRLHNGGMFFTYSDATAQVKSEADLEAENVTLEQRVRERTEELQTLNFELARAKADADDANVSKTRFLAAASHDLLQPLNAARLYTTSLRERLRGSGTVEDASMLATHIDASLESVEDILGALLEISHLDAGATKTEITTFALQGILRQLQIEFLPLARERGLRLKFAPSSVWVTSDRRLLSRLLQNLISNAIKYTNEGSVLVGVRSAGTNVRIDVHDTGLGIPKAKQGVIFREFERLPPAARAAPGVGLGLSIVERLGRVLRHEIRVRSQVGKGSIFSVTLPRAEAMPVGSPGAPPVGVSARQRSLEGLAVVAVDNERHILNGMEILLQGWDCIVTTGTDLHEIESALAVRDIVPDVILADFHIDEIDGLDVIAALRTRHGHCPAVLITADRDPSIRDRAFAADVRVLNKPLKPAALRALLSQWRLVKAAAE